MFAELAETVVQKMLLRIPLYLAEKLTKNGLCQMVWQLGPYTKGSLSLGETHVLTNSRDWKCKHCTFKWENGDFQELVINQQINVKT